MNPRPLEGVRVLELARVLAGPWAGQTLADLGADVIKVESPNGDETRSWGPPFVKDGQGRNLGAAYYHSCNRGKRSIALDFTNSEDLETVRRLVARSDVVIENFKVGGLKKFGLDYPTLSRNNPGLIYCSITGFGQDGPYAPRPGYDLMIQAMGGIMDLTGPEDGAPQKIGVAHVDLFTGLYAVIAIQSALIRRQSTGAGAYIDMALLDTQIGVLANQAMNYLVSGTPPGRMGSAHPNIVPYQAFPASDGYLIIAAGNDGHFLRLCRLLEIPELARDPDFAGNADRVANRRRLIPLLEQQTRRFTRNELLQRLEQASIPAGPINDLQAVFEDPQVIHRNLAIPLPLDGQTTVTTVRSPIRFADCDLTPQHPSPRLDQHRREILAELAGSDNREKP